jgi:hypothetical protein
MKCTFVGHATWLVQAGRGTILMDPLLAPEFRDGLFEVCPTRRVRIERLPAIDAIVLSHAHRDHFDLATLAALDRSAQVYTPDSPQIRHALRRLGFHKVTIVDARSFHTTGDLQTVFMPWSESASESGAVFSDGEVSFWNQVDTHVSADAIEKLRRAVGAVDLVAHGYQCMLETEALHPRSVEFPLEGYGSILHRAKLLAPRALVPASNGYRVRGPGEWLNRFKFPISRERFVEDVGRMLPATRTFIANPGDVLEVGRRGTVLRRQAAENGFVRTTRDDAHDKLAFWPVASRPALEDTNPRRLAPAALRDATALFFEDRMRPFCRRLGPLHPLRQIEAVIEYRVLQPDRRKPDCWTVVLRRGGVRVMRGAPPRESDFAMEIGASTLHDLVYGRTRSDIVLLGGLYRAFGRAYRVEPPGLATLQQRFPREVHADYVADASDLLFAALYGSPRAEELLVDAELDLVLEPGSRGSARAARALDRPFWERRIAPLDAA